MRVIDSMRANKVTVHSPGRRWGKSSCRPYLIVDNIGRRPGWVEGCCGAQDHAEAKNIWEKDLLAFSAAGIVADQKNEDQRRYIDFIPIICEEEGFECDANEGGRVWYPSLGPDAHRKFQGKGLQFAILDECSHLPELAWTETIDPMLADTGGPALLQGSPIPEGIGFAWFAGEAEKGSPANEDRYDPRYHAITGPSEENPHIDHGEVRAKRQALIRAGRHALAACLYDGRFVTDLGAVFTNLDNVFVLPAKEVEPGLWIYRLAHPGEPVVFGLDFGRHDDATVVVCYSRASMEQLGLLKIDRTEYLVQLPIIDRFLRRFGRGPVWAEGREEAAAELLRRQYGDSCFLVKWTNGGTFDKNTAVARGMDLCERAAWRLINAKWQREEFRLFARERLPSGRWQYAAPAKKHDDSVAANLYAVYGLPLSPSVESGARVVRPAGRDDAARIIRAAREVPSAPSMPFVLRRGA